MTRAKGLATEVKYHKVEVADEDTFHRILTGLPPCSTLSVKVVLRDKVSLDELKRALVKREELKRQPDGADGDTLTAGL